MRSTETIESLLPEPLLGAYREQLLTIMKAIAGREESVALEFLRDTMLQTLVQGYGLPVPEAASLSKLATSLPPRVPGTTPTHAAVERLALQRALLVARLGPTLAPYYLAAGRGAIEGFATEEENVIDPHEITKPRPNVPTLRPIHSQDDSLDDIGPSPIFTDKWS